MNKSETLTITLPQDLINNIRQIAPAQQFILKAIEYYLQTHPLEAEEPTDATGLCGIWDDPRPAEEIIDEIISARTPGREIAL